MAYIEQESITLDRNDNWLFLKKFFTSPKTIGSVRPSSKYLAREMIKHIKWNQVTSLIELGAGTGVFTDYIYKLKKPECTALIFELDREMRKRLQKRYPTLDCYPDAGKIKKIFADYQLKKVDCIISGLPFANFSEQERLDILDGVVKSLKPGGMFVAFQYSLQMKNLLKKEFSQVNISFVPFNIPPAFVYTCYKEQLPKHQGER